MKTITNMIKLNTLQKQITLFLFVGGGCAAFDLSLMFFFVEIANLTIRVSFILAITLSTLLNYVLNIKLVFTSGRHKKNKEIVLFILNSLLAIALNYLIMFVMINMFDVWYLLSRSVALIIVSIMNFILRKYLIFLK